MVLNDAVVTEAKGEAADWILWLSVSIDTQLRWSRSTLVLVPVLELEVPAALADLNSCAVFDCDTPWVLMLLGDAPGFAAKSSSVRNKNQGP